MGGQADVGKTKVLFGVTVVTEINKSVNESNISRILLQ